MSARISPPRPVRFCSEGWFLQYARVDGQMQWAIGDNWRERTLLAPAMHPTAAELASAIAASTPNAPANELVRIVTEHRPELLDRSR